MKNWNSLSWKKACFPDENLQVGGEGRKSLKAHIGTFHCFWIHNTIKFLKGPWNH